MPAFLIVLMAEDPGYLSLQLRHVGVPRPCNTSMSNFVTLSLASLYYRIYSFAQLQVPYGAFDSIMLAFSTVPRIINWLT